MLTYIENKKKLCTSAARRWGEKNPQDWIMGSGPGPKIWPDIRVQASFDNYYFFSTKNPTL